MSYHTIPLGKKAPETINTVIEIPKGGHNKYEYDEELDEIRLDRTLHSPLFYPVDYGFVPETRAEDGDHLDALVLTDDPVFTGCVMEIRPIGLLKMSDENGLDNKVLAVPAKNPHYHDIQDLKDVQPHFLAEIVHFFEQYKKLEKKFVKVEGWGSKKNALAVIKKANARYLREHHG
jgi:inorganic pyrophosphatase